MKRLLAVVAVLEGVTGMALMISPSIVARLLLGADLAGAGAAVGRVAGFALVSLGLACWPFREPASRHSPALLALLTYNLLVACYLIFLGIGGQFSGILLWPAVAIHGFFTLLFVRAWLRSEPTPDSKA
jgi:hypothetical protein